VRPAYVLVGLVALDLVVVAAFAARARHNGWLYSTPGPAMHDWTASWALGHLWAPSAADSYGVAALEWPLALAFGGSLPAGLPVVVVVQAAIGGAAILLATYGIASRIAGRIFGYTAAIGWIVAPILALGFFYSGRRVFQFIPYDDYRGLVRDVAVPNALGLTHGAAFLSLVALVVAAWLVVRALDTGDWNEVLLGGLVAGFAVALAPGNVAFLPAPVLALAVARRWRLALAFVLALLPAFATLALWRWTALGHVGGFDGFAFTRQDFWINRNHFRGAGWSLLLVEWIAVAGSFGLIRKAPAKGVLVAAWFAGFFIAKSGSIPRGRVLDASIYRLLEPAYPAFVLLAAGTLLLIPGWGRRRIVARVPERRPRLTRGLAAAVVVLGVYPLALVALAGPTPRGRVVVNQAQDVSVPVTDAFDLQVARSDGRATLNWQEPPADGVALSYQVYRGPGPGCDRPSDGGGDCLLRMAGAGLVRSTTWTDPDPGRFWYRVAAVADYREDGKTGDLLLISPAER
jgi:hypothetical protein